jgi:hypothetical protein
MIKNNYEVDIIINGSPIKSYYKNGDVYFEGRKGQEYSLRIKNNGFSRILAIPTIDGLSVLNGKEADYNSPGYVLNGYDSITIDGWRTSDSEVAEFYFSDPNDSYSKRKDKKDNVGVIGVAIFKERYRQPITFTYTCQESKPYFTDNAFHTTSTPAGTIMSLKNSFDTTNSAMNCSCNNFNSQDIGTGFGDYKRSEVITVGFEKESYPDTVFTLYYNTREQLEKMGIDFNERPKYVSPQAFPNHYCEPPR